MHSLYSSKSVPMKTRFHLKLVILYGVTALFLLFLCFYSLRQFDSFAKCTKEPASVSMPVESKIISMDASDTLALSNDEQRYVRHIHSMTVSFDNKKGNHYTCPNRYVFVSMRGFGRHHNQLRMLMNSILWAERMKRTAVLGWFFVEPSHWVSHNLLYNFSVIRKHYCVVTADEMKSRLSKEGSQETFTVVSHGVILNNTPMEPYIRKMKWSMKPELPRVTDYLSQQGIIQCCGLNSLLEAQETLIVISPEFVLHMRRGLADHAAIYGLLRPSAKVSRLLTKFIKHFFTPGSKYFAVHKRHREGTCYKEMNKALHKAQAIYRVKLDSAREKRILSQCKIDVLYLSALHKAFGLRLFSYPLFIAHDGQDTRTILWLVSLGARVYEEMHYRFFRDCYWGLCALAVDFFVMVEGEYFTGNILSSFSQNVCFTRLGRGRACHAMEPGVMRMLSHDVLKRYPGAI